MDAERIDILARSLIAAGSRRAALAAVLGGSLGLLGLADTAAKKKGKGKNKKKKPGQACAASCNTTCSTCYTRSAGGTLCGGIGAADCNIPCTSDNDCIGTIHPFCTKSFTVRATGKTSTWGCPAACTSIGSCSP
jgi:hypothetical protein